MSLVQQTLLTIWEIWQWMNYLIQKIKPEHLRYLCIDVQTQLAQTVQTTMILSKEVFVRNVKPILKWETNCVGFYVEMGLLILERNVMMGIWSIWMDVHHLAKLNLLGLVFGIITILFHRFVFKIVGTELFWVGKNVMTAIQWTMTAVPQYACLSWDSIVILVNLQSVKKFVETVW